MANSAQVKREHKASLTDDEARLVGTLAELEKVDWQQFNQRRDFEFRVTLTLWSGLAAAIAVSLTSDGFPGIAQGQVVFVVAGIVLVLLHGYWCIGLSGAQEKDRRVALFYEGEIHELCGTTFPKELRQELDASRRVPKYLRWSIFVQFAVTCLLAVSLMAVNWQRLSTSRPVTRTDLEVQKLELEIKKLQLDTAKPIPSSQAR